MASRGHFSPTTHMDAVEEQAERGYIVGSLRQILAHLHEGMANPHGADVHVELDSSEQVKMGRLSIQSSVTDQFLTCNYRVENGNVFFDLETKGSGFLRQGMVLSPAVFRVVSLEFLKQVLHFIRKYVQLLEVDLDRGEWNRAERAMLAVIMGLPQGEQHVNDAQVTVQFRDAQDCENFYSKRVAIIKNNSLPLYVELDSTGLSLSVFQDDKRGPGWHQTFVSAMNSRISVSMFQELMEHMCNYQRASMRADVKAQVGGVLD